MFYFFSTSVLATYFCFISANQNAVHFLNDSTVMCAQNVTPIRMQGIVKEASQEVGKDWLHSTDVNINRAQVNDLIRKPETALLPDGYATIAMQRQIDSFKLG